MELGSDRVGDALSGPMVSLGVAATNRIVMNHLMWMSLPHRKLVEYLRGANQWDSSSYEENEMELQLLVQRA